MDRLLVAKKRILILPVAARESLSVARGILSESFFSTSYEAARQKFLDAVLRAGGRTKSYTLEHNTNTSLSMDVGILGAEVGSTLLVSSGLHGIEGFAGSAIQLAWLDQFARRSPSDNTIRYLLIHAINPFGFSNLRRVNEDNVDLNRNFITPHEQYAGASDGYQRLNRFLNPASPPSNLEFFKLKVLWNILRFGLPKLKESIACGQYEFPTSIFYGGRRSSWSTQIIQQQCDEWLASASSVIHVDVHTGLGKFGLYKLLVTESQPEESLTWYQATYGAEAVELMTQPGGTAYQASGVFGTWMQKHFKDIEYHTAGAEFGTYDVVRILAALRAENRAHHYALPESSVYRQAKRELFECFCPSSVQWRENLIQSGLRIIEQSVQALKRGRPIR